MDLRSLDNIIKNKDLAIESVHSAIVSGIQMEISVTILSALVRNIGYEPDRAILTRWIIRELDRYHETDVTWARSAQVDVLEGDGEGADMEVRVCKCGTHLMRARIAQESSTAESAGVTRRTHR